MVDRGSPGWVGRRQGLEAAFSNLLGVHFCSTTTCRVFLLIPNPAFVNQESQIQTPLLTFFRYRDPDDGQGRLFGAPPPLPGSSSFRARFADLHFEQLP
jgi:hypothetical protein